VIRESLGRVAISIDFVAVPMPAHDSLRHG
jgi:hypothetical protein